MDIGKLHFNPIAQQFNLVAPPVADSVKTFEVADFIFVSQVNPESSDTASFCQEYEVGLDISCNCLVVEAKRADKTWYAACLVVATNVADVNGIIRKYLNARRVSFASMETALALTGMEYGGITPIGVPNEWPVLVDETIMQKDVVIIGGGVRGSKLAVKTELFHHLAGATIMRLTK